MNLHNLWRLARMHPLVPIVLLLAVATLTGCQTTAAPDPAVRYIAFGDSTTAGPATRQYWEFLRDDLALPANSFAGQGNGGETTPDGLPRLASLLDGGVYPNAQALLFWEGGDDILKFVQEHDPLLVLSPKATDYPFTSDLDVALDGMQINIEEAIRMGRRGGLTVYVATYFNLSPDAGPCKPTLLNILLPAQAARANEYVALLNDRIRQAVANAGATLVDVATVATTLTVTPANYANCNHLSSQGNQIVAGIFRSAITAQTGQTEQTSQTGSTDPPGSKYPW